MITLIALRNAMRRLLRAILCRLGHHAWLTVDVVDRETNIYVEQVSFCFDCPATRHIPA